MQWRRLLVSLLCPVVFFAPSPSHAVTEVWVILGTGSETPRIDVVHESNVVATYTIAAPRHTPRCLSAHSVWGEVTFVDPHASWVPTEATKRAAARKKQPLANYYAPEHPKNALAGRKIGVRWNDPCINSAVRIHGTIRPDQIGQRVSRGCIRMHNADWDVLQKMVQPGTTIYLGLQPPRKFHSARD